MQAWLEGLLAKHGAIAGTVHVVSDDDLVLAAHVRIPPPVIAKVQFVPHGKGMGGVAQTRREPVQTCNLKTDESGTIKPVAKMVDANAAIAVPVLVDGRVTAVVGLAFGFVGEIPEDKMAQMSADALTVPIPAEKKSGPDDLVGEWMITYGITPAGQVYDGKLVIEPGLRLRWDIGGGRREGLAIWNDGALISGYGRSAAESGAVLYLDAGDGGLVGRWTHPTLGGSLGSEVVGRDGRVVIADGDGQAIYKGELQRTDRSVGCELKWTGPSGEYAGVGLRRRGLLGGSWWTPGSAIGAMWLEVTAEGLSGRFVEPGVDGLGRVMLIRGES